MFLGNDAGLESVVVVVIAFGCSVEVGMYLNRSLVGVERRYCQLLQRLPCTVGHLGLRRQQGRCCWCSLGNEMRTN